MESAFQAVAQVDNSVINGVSYNVELSKNLLKQFKEMHGGQAFSSHLVTGIGAAAPPKLAAPNTTSAKYPHISGGGLIQQEASSKPSRGTESRVAIPPQFKAVSRANSIGSGTTQVAEYVDEEQDYVTADHRSLSSSISLQPNPPVPQQKPNLLDFLSSTEYQFAEESQHFSDLTLSPQNSYHSVSNWGGSGSSGAVIDGKPYSPVSVNITAPINNEVFYDPYALPPTNSNAEEGTPRGSLHRPGLEHAEGLRSQSFSREVFDAHHSPSSAILTRHTYHGQELRDRNQTNIYRTNANVNHSPRYSGRTGISQSQFDDSNMVRMQQAPVGKLPVPPSRVQSWYQQSPPRSYTNPSNMNQQGMDFYGSVGITNQKYSPSREFVQHKQQLNQTRQATGGQIFGSDCDDSTIGQREFYPALGHTKIDSPRDARSISTSISKQQPPQLPLPQQLSWSQTYNDDGGSSEDDASLHSFPRFSRDQETHRSLATISSSPITPRVNYNNNSEIGIWLQEDMGVGDLCGNLQGMALNISSEPSQQNLVAHYPISERNPYEDLNTSGGQLNPSLSNGPAAGAQWP